ncbi:MAG: glycosyl hydrolase [Bacteriophage sp.]|jgi:lysozyme family protein|nr:MAG: glycosyl hydrolase [Bacteriophage sp.]
MADVKKFEPFVLKWEGGAKYTNSKIDRGGATKYGITIATWRTVGYDKNGDGKIDENDVKLITEEDFTKVLKKNFWDKWKADQIKNQKVAEILVDWLWASGKWGIIKPQQLLGVKADGIVGKQTLAAVNGYPNQRQLFDAIKNARKAYIDKVIKNDPRQIAHKVGWLNRINSITFED